MANLPADDRLAELREHIALNFTTDARVAIAWAPGEIARLREQLSRVHDALERIDPTAASIVRAAIEPPGVDGLFVDNFAPRGKPCTCPDTSATACGVERGHKLGELWYCQRAALTRGADS